MENPVSGEVVAALGAFIRGGVGPSHSLLTSAFQAAGLTGLTPYVPGSMQNLNKVERIREAGRSVWREAPRGRQLVEELLSVYRVDGVFADSELGMEKTALRNALRERGWALDDEGRLEPLGEIHLEVGDRQALNDQLNRLRRNTEDAALLLGTAKEVALPEFRFNV